MVFGFSEITQTGIDLVKKFPLPVELENSPFILHSFGARSRVVG
jgi:hypothetical protein